MVKLHPKIQAVKERARHFEERAISVNEFGELVNSYAEDLKNGIVTGYAVRWGQPNEYREVFLKGAFAKSIGDNGPQTNSNYQIKFLNTHRQEDALSLFASLEEDEYGLRFRTLPLDERDIPQSSAASILRKLTTGTLNNFSIGFDYIWEQMEYDEAKDLIIIKQARLFEISVVSIPADMGTFAMRSLEQIEDLHDDTEEFIRALPRKHQMEARQLFARHKSLVNVEPQEPKREAIHNEPTTEGIDYDYLLTNLKSNS